MLASLLGIYLSDTQLDRWLISAETDEHRMIGLGDEWAPLPDSIVFSSQN